MSPFLFGFLSNVVAILALAAIGYGIFYSVNIQQSKLYGDHCKSDDDCQANKNLICQSGKCMCSQNTYYDSSSFAGKCGKIL